LLVTFKVIKVQLLTLFVHSSQNCHMWNTTSKSVNLLDRLDFDIEARCLIKKNIQVCKIRARQFCDECTKVLNQSDYITYINM
jgi:hypothetical protein